MTDVDKLLDELLKGKSPEEILGENGLLKEYSELVPARAAYSHSASVGRR